MYIYIYIYIERERERERDTLIYFAQKLLQLNLKTISLFYFTSLHIDTFIYTVIYRRNSKFDEFIP